MQKYHFSDATNYTFAQLSELHNASFSGYFFPMSMTAKMTADFWRINQIDANRCVVMYDSEGAFVGMARMGTRGKRGWCGGFGIVPQFRGTGASKQLAAQMVQVARETGLASLQLEVLTQNVRAIKTYESVGFTSWRKLLGVELATSALPRASSLSVSALPLEALLPWLDSTQRPGWGREVSTLLAMNMEAIVAHGSDGLLNGVVVQRTGEQVRLHGAVLRSQLTDADLAALLRYAAGDATTIQVFNEPENSPFLAHCLRLGFSEFFSQYEMLINLSA